MTVLLNGETGEVFAMVRHRNEAPLSAFLLSQGRRWCRGVEVVVSDGSESYGAAIRKHLGHATHVLDRFHVVRWFAAGLIEVRRRIQRREPRGHVRPAIHPEVFRSRFLALRRADRLGEAEHVRLQALFAAHADLARAWGMLQELHGLYQAEDEEQAMEAFDRFARLYEDDPLPEFYKVVDTLLAKAPEVFNFHRAGRFERLLRETSEIVVASGIVSIWAGTPEVVSSAAGQLEQAYPGRFLLGIGTSHAPLVANYERPYSRMEEFLDRLDELGQVTRDRRVLAALRPRMLELASRRSAGAHPYFVPVEHTARARELLGPDPLLTPEMTAVICRDKAAGRSLARGFASGYLALTNYAENLKSLGWGDDDLSGGGSDRLVEAVVAVGDIGDAALRVRQHLEVGADHVCAQLLSEDGALPIEAYRELIAELR